MPIYEYVAVDADAACEACREPFEARQSMSDQPLRKCPVCGCRVERMISRCGISTRGEKSMLSDKNLKAKGFTKLVNEGDGKFRKI